MQMDGPYILNWMIKSFHAPDHNRGGNGTNGDTSPFQPRRSTKRLAPHVEIKRYKQMLKHTRRKSTSTRDVEARV